MAPAMIGEITTGSTSSATKTCRPGIRSRNRKARSRPEDELDRQGDGEEEEGVAERLPEAARRASRRA